MNRFNIHVQPLKIKCRKVIGAYKAYQGIPILERQLWTPTAGKTPEQSICGSIFREINNKAHPRIAKSNVKGKFVIAV